MAKSKAERGRFSSRKKMDVVLRVLRGIPTVSDSMYCVVRP